MPEFFRRLRADGSEAPTLWTRLNGRRVSTGCADQATARIWKRAQQRKAADPRLAASERAQLADACEDLVAELGRRGRSAATLRRAKEKLANIRALLGDDRPMSEIDARLVNEYIDVRLKERGVSEGSTVSRLTVRDELAFLRQVLKLARRHGTYALHVDDVLPVRFETGHKPKKDWVREADLPKLLAHVEPRHAAHLLYFVCCAGRLADSYRSEREDWHMAKGKETVLVRGGKTPGSWRTNPITDFLLPYVRRMLKDAEGKGVLFVNWPHINRDLSAACVRAGISKVSTNGLRRTFGHWHRLHGYSLDIISKLFGHTTAKLARDVYADSEGEELRTAMEASRRSPNRDRYRNGTGSTKTPQKPRATRTIKPLS
jgi:integrase